MLASTVLIKLFNKIAEHSQVPIAFFNTLQGHEFADTEMNSVVLITTLSTEIYHKQSTVDADKNEHFTYSLFENLNFDVLCFDETMSLERSPQTYLQALVNSQPFMNLLSANDLILRVDDTQEYTAFGWGADQTQSITFEGNVCYSDKAIINFYRAIDDIELKFISPNLLENFYVQG